MKIGFAIRIFIAPAVSIFYDLSTYSFGLLMQLSHKRNVYGGHIIHINIQAQYTW